MCPFPIHCQSKDKMWLLQRLFWRWNLGAWLILLSQKQGETIEYEASLQDQASMSALKNEILTMALNAFFLPLYAIFNLS